MPHQIFPLPEITYPLKVDTLGKLLAQGYEITAHCGTYRCHHRARINLVQLGRKVGRDYVLSHDSMRPHFRCSKCEAAGRDPRNISFRLSPCTDPHCDVQQRHSYPCATVR